MEPPQFASSINRNKTQNSRKPKGLLLSPPGGITTELTRELWIFDHFFEQGVASLHEGSVPCLGLSVAQRNASHNSHNLACFSDKLVRVPFHKSHFLKRNRKVLWHFRVVFFFCVSSLVVFGRFVSGIPSRLRRYEVRSPSDSLLVQNSRYYIFV